MENKKDIQKTESAVRFLDYQTLRSNFFGDNKVGERIYKRAERLSSAIVLITKHMPDSESLKSEARKSSFEVLSYVLDIKDDMRSPNSDGVNKLKTSVRKTISFVRLLAISGNVSLQNAEIVIEAYDELVSFLNVSRRSNLTDSVVFTRDDFSDMRDVARPVEGRQSSPSGVAVIASQKGEGVSSGLEAAPRAAIPASSRTQAILEVLRSNGELGIRDVAANLPEYSEKMIQRELAELVLQGKVRKMGEKRWSRYSSVEATI